MKIKPLFLISCLFLPTLTFAADATSCKDTVDRRANIQIQILFSEKSKNCFLTVTSLKKPTMVYRDYLFSSDGNFLVFNSLSEGEEVDSTAAREFYLFPRMNSAPTYQWNDGQRRLEVTPTNGDVFYFDYDTAQINGMGRGQVIVSAEIKKENRGGVEILNYQGLVLDAGFAVGHSPSAVSSGAALFQSSNGNQCNLLNRDLFKVSGTQDIIFKYSDHDLVPFLQGRCPQLQYPSSNLYSY